MIQFKIISLTLLTSLTFSCSKADDVDSSGSRLEPKNEPIPVDTTNAGSVPTTAEGGTMLTGLIEDLLALTPTLTLVGTLSSPQVNNAALHASDITVNGTKVYVAYNTAGDTKAGGVDVIDIAAPTAPFLASESLYSDSDINKVAINGTSLYTVGSSADGNALLSKITLDGSGKLTSTRSSVALQSSASASSPAYAGTSVIATAANVYALSGNNGGLTILNASDLSLKSFTGIDDARDLTFNTAKTSVYVVTGKTATAEAATKRYNATSGIADATYTQTLANAKIDAGKSTIIAGSSTAIATAGSGGARFICQADGSTLGIAPNPALASLAADDQVANAAAFGNGLLYVANGGAGISIYAVNVPLIQIGCLGMSLTYLGRFSLGDDASVNNVYYSNGYLVAATGTKGFKIIKVQQSLLSGLLMLL